MKMDVLSLDDRLHIEDFLDWVHTVKIFFWLFEYFKRKSSKARGVYKLKGGAFAWWEQLQYNH